MPGADGGSFQRTTLSARQDPKQNAAGKFIMTHEPQHDAMVEPVFVPKTHRKPHKGFHGHTQDLAPHKVGFFFQCFSFSLLIANSRLILVSPWTIDS